MSTRADRTTDRVARNATIGALAIIVAFITVTAIMVAPSGALPAASGMKSAMSPYFTQRWTLFAPNVLKSNYYIEVQAGWSDADGGRRTSDWIGLTDLEHAFTGAGLARPRISMLSWNAARTYRERYLALDEDQREYTRTSFIESDGDDGFEARDPVVIADELSEGKDNRSDVIRFLRVDHMFRTHVTNFTTAYLGRDVDRIRWRVTITRANDFAHRHDETQQFTDTVTTYGWRQARRTVRPDVEAAYLDVIERYDPERSLVTMGE